jgi:hypothetical protein
VRRPLLSRPELFKAADLGVWASDSVLVLREAALVPVFLPDLEPVRVFLWDLADLADLLLREDLRPLADRPLADLLLREDLRPLAERLLADLADFLPFADRLLADLADFLPFADLRADFLPLADLRPFLPLEDFLEDFKPDFLPFAERDLADLADLRPFLPFEDLRADLLFLPLADFEDLRPLDFLEDVLLDFFPLDLRPEDLARELDLRPEDLADLALDLRPEVDFRLEVDLRPEEDLRPLDLADLAESSEADFLEVAFSARERPLGLSRFKAAGLALTDLTESPVEALAATALGATAATDLAARV